MKTFFSFLIVAGALFGESIYLNNDSPYTLIAEIDGANGIFLTQVVLQPNDLINVSFTVPSDQIRSATPFYVVWRCPYGGEYANISAVSADFIRASQSLGAKTCAPKTKDQNRQK